MFQGIKKSFFSISSNNHHYQNKISLILAIIVFPNRLDNERATFTPIQQPSSPLPHNLYHGYVTSTLDSNLNSEYCWINGVGVEEVRHTAADHDAT